MTKAVDFYFDFISPYAALALIRAQALADDNDFEWRIRPIALGPVLSATGLVGPAEVDSKRRYTFEDVLRCAALAGLDFQFPPAHPFRSLEALRLVTAFQDQPMALALSAKLAALTWIEGKSLEEPETLDQAIEAVGLDRSEGRAAITCPDAKQTLRENGEAFLKLGGFGVPTFVWEGQLFWGQDRIDHLLAAMNGSLRLEGAHLRSVLERPSTAQRKR